MAPARTIADLQPGDHLCCLYETEAEHRALLTPFMRQGLERGEKVIYIVDARAAEAVLDYLRDDGLEVGSYLDSGQLAILTSAETYVPDGSFDPDRMIALLRSETERARTEGYAALRVTGEMTWVLRGQPGSERLIEYEAKLNTFFPGSRCLALCQYDRQRFDPVVLLDVLTTHPLAVIGTEVYENSYYIPAEDSLGVDRPVATLRRWIANLGSNKRAAEELRQQRDFAAAVVDTVGALVVVLDPQGCIVRFNRACEVTTGYTAAEVLGRPFWDIFLIPEEVAVVRATFERLRAGDFPTQLENYWVTKDGRQRMIAWTNSALLDSRGMVEHIIGTGIDITASRQAEEALRQSELKFKTLFDILPIGVSLLDEQRKVVDANPALERVLRMPRDAILAGAYSGRRYIRPDGSPMSEEEMPSVRASQERRIVQDTEIGVVDKDGETFWVSVGASPFPLPGFGGALVATDITARKQAEKDLRESEGRLRRAYELLEAVTSGTEVIVTVLDTSFRYVFFNEAYREEIKRLANQDIQIGSSMLEAFAPLPEQQEIARQQWSRTLRGESANYRIGFGDPGRYRRTYSVRHIPIRNAQGDVVGAGEVAFDITEQVRAEQALQEAKDQLEIRIQERTAELEEFNRALQQEVAERQRAAAIAVAERQRFNDVLEALPAYVVLLTPDYHASFANRVFRQRFGESHGQRCYEFLFHRTTPCSACETYRVLKTGAPHHWVWTGPDGRDYEVYDFPFVDTDGTTLILEMGIDITERKRAEQALKELNETLEQHVTERTAELRETRDYLDNLLTYANAPIIVWDPEFRITRFNGAFERLTGLAADHAIGKPLDILFPEDRKEEAMAYIRRTVTGERWEVVEIPILHVDGTVRTVLWNSATLYAADNATPVATIAQGQDITERKRAEEALRASEERFHGLYSSMVEGVVLHEVIYNTQGQAVDYVLLDVNPAFERITGLPRAQAVGQTGSALYGVGQAPYLEVYAQVAASGQPAHFESYFPPMEKHFRISVFSFARGQFATVFDDITQAKLAEVEREQRTARLAALVQISQQVLAETTVAGLLQGVVDAACELVGARICIAGHSYQQGAFEIGATSRGEGVPPCPPGEELKIEQGGVYMRLIEKRVPLRLTAEELHQHPDWWGLPAGHIPLRGLLGVPLFGLEDHPIGLIMASDKQQGDFTAEDEALLAQLATVSSLGLRHIQARTDAERRAEEMNTFLQALTDGVVVYDANGRVTWANPAAVELLGIDPQDQSRLDVVSQLRIRHPDGQPVSTDELPSSCGLRGETMRNERFLFASVVGREMIMLVSASPLVLDGKVAGAVAIWNDVTEREHLIDEVQRRAAELDATVTSIADGVVIYGPAGQIVHINELAQEMLGYSDADRGRTIPERLADLHVRRADGTPLASADEWPPLMALHGQTVRNAAMSWQRLPDEPPVTTLISAAPIRDAHGAPLGAVATFTDVSELRTVQQQLEQVNVELAQQAEKLVRRNRNLRLLNQISQEMGAALELAQLLEQISRAARDVVSADGSILWITDPERSGDLVCRAASYRGLEQCAPDTQVRPGEGLSGWVAQQRQSALVNRTGEDARFSSRTDVPGGFPVGAVLAAPMLAHDVLLGVLEVVHQEEGGFDAEGLILIETLASAAAIALENIRLHEQAREAAVVSERSRLARELHDAVSQTLFSASVIAESLPRLWERKPERAIQGLEQLRQLTRGALSEMRALLLELRPTALAESKLVDLLQQLVDAFSSRVHGAVSLDAESQRAFPPNVQIALYRIAQEALNNVSKHARATQVQVGLHDRGDQVELWVKDDGRGFDPAHVPQNRLGLGILHERAESIGADLRVSSRPGHGTEIRVFWPGEKGDHANA